MAAVFLTVGADYAFAVDPNQPAASYIRTNYGVEDGLSSNVVNSILQTRDGFLWLGTDAGLDRFDGRHFTPINFRGPGATPQGIVNSLAEGLDGDLWIGTNAGLVRIFKPGLDNFDRSQPIFYHPGAATGGRDLGDEITCLAVNRDGTVWVGTSLGLYRFRDSKFETVIPREFISHIEKGAEGRMLIVTSHRFVEADGVRLLEHADLGKELGVSGGAIYQVFQDHSGTTWYCTGAGLARRVRGAVERFYSGSGVLRVFEDPQRNLWVRRLTGVYRVSSTGLDPLPLDISPRYIYGDRQNNLWVGTNGEGLFRFKDRPVRMFTKADGLPNNIPMTVLSKQDGSLWVGNNCGGLSVFDGKRFRTYDEKDGLLNSCVWSLAEARNGDLWVGTWGGGLFRFADGHFVQFSHQEGLAGEIVRSIAAARDGSLWIATEYGLSHMINGRFRTYTVADGLSSDRIVSVYEDRRGGIWAGTSRGIDRMNGSRFAAVPFRRVKPAIEIRDPRYISFGEDPAGKLYVLSALKGVDRIEGNLLAAINHDFDLLSMASFRGPDVWFSGANGIFRLSGSSPEKIDQSHEKPFDYSIFGKADGMNSTQCGIGAPNIATAADGKLWVATVQGLAMLEPAQLRRNNVKPVIFVEGVTVGKERQPVGRELVLPPGTHHVELQFDSIELASPEKIHFQYRLDGVDTEWLDAGSSFSAIYTNFARGTHQFHLRACNSDGIWDHTGITYQITQVPFYYETRLFQFAVGGTVILLLGCAYWFRLHQITIQMNARLNERVTERTRLARELHDTLLQTIHASAMMLHAAREVPDNPSLTVTALERLSEWLGRATEEARTSLQSLRSSVNGNNDLVDELRLAGEECRSDNPIRFVISVHGETREMHPIVRDEVYQIGREAIRNACSHSCGSIVEVKLKYARDLVLHVSDDGKGMEPEVVLHGRPGHFGLKGMRERAARIGGRVTVQSSEGVGTRIEVTVPGRSTYRQQGVLRRMLSNLRLWRRTGRNAS